VNAPYRWPVSTAGCADRRLVDVDDLVEEFQPGELRRAGQVLAGSVQGAWRLPCGSCRSAASMVRRRHTPSRRVIRAERDRLLTFFRLLPRARTRAAALWDVAPLPGTLRTARRQCWPVIESELAMIARRCLPRRCGRLHARHRGRITTCPGGWRPRRARHDDRVAESRSASVEHRSLSPLVQADRGLVEHIEDAGQARPDLRGEADTLAFAA
jgi:hypothetical protein